MPPPRPRVSLDTRLMSERLLLRAGDSADWKQWRALRDLSRDYLVPWEPLWPPNALSYGFYCALLRKQWRDWRAGRAFAFTIFLDTGNVRPVLVGGITLGDVHYASAQKGTIGYWVGKPYAGQGIMTEAVRMVCDFAFDRLRLHRVEASCMPANEASKTVLRRAGFDEEGFAKAYLQINGTREDHLLWGKRRG
ncbi:MAG: GNAT family N-acetyltransferase [Alphaproteobacteria bacterium]|nr:GNAT family N-acetyltransferase [Alphaproteobacteria bacterium]